MLTLLSCVLHNPVITLEALFSRGADQLTAFFRELIDEGNSNQGACIHKKLQSAYELKVFAVALTNIIFTGTD